MAVRAVGAHQRLAHHHHHVLSSSRVGRRMKTTSAAITEGEERIIDVELADEAKNSYLSYAMSVIVGRALPDVRDGLKPVHRRILYGMHELGLKSASPHRKCARVVGDVLGKYHPHGDGSVYEALVRLAQDFSMSAPLVDGHGNFGSLDDDPPAAMRYTECRLNKLAEQGLLADIASDCVNFTETFDGSQLEPEVLPARVPNLLINGASGIAVAVATNMAPHNLGESIDAMCALAQNPNATLDELMKYLPAPDFPTGGVVTNKQDMKAIYRTGKGAITLRGRATIEHLSKKGMDRNAIVISEIPYQTNKASLVEQIADHVNAKTIEGVSDIRDESDRDGMRVVIEIKRGHDASQVLNNLYKKTRLEVKYFVNNVCLVENKPTVMSLHDMLNEFIKFRVLTIERRSKFALEKAQDRKHLVEGYIAVLSDADGVVRIIRASKDGPSAAKQLRASHGLSDVQADAILAMPLRRLTGLEADKLEAEMKELKDQITYYQGLLNEKSKVVQVLVEEAQAAKEAFVRPRKTSLESISESIIQDDDEPPKDNIMTLSSRGYVKRICPKSFDVQHRRTRGKRMSKLRGGDELNLAMHCKDTDQILFFSDRGRLQKIPAKAIPQSDLNTIGVPVTSLLSTFAKRNQSVTAMLATSMTVNDVSDDQVIVMLTNQGKVSVAAAKALLGQKGKNVIKLEKGDRLKQVLFARTSDHLYITGQNNDDKAMVLHCKVSDFRVVRSACRPIVGIKFMGDKAQASPAAEESEAADDDDEDDDNEDDDDEVLPSRTAGMVLITDERLQGASEDGPWLLYLTRNGKGKLVPADSYRVLGRGRAGVTCMKFKKKDDALAVLAVVDRIGPDVADEILLSTTAGVANRLSVNDLPQRADPNSQGANIIRLDDNDFVKSVNVLSAEDLSELAI
jgi:DNA gyrase subunit A